MSPKFEAADVNAELAAPIRRRTVRHFQWTNLIKLAGVAIGIYFAYLEFRPGTRFSVTWKHTHGLHAGALVTYNGDAVGQVIGTKHLINDGLVNVMMEIDPDKSELASRLLVDTTRFYIDRPTTDNLRLIHVDQAIKPRSVVVKTGSPNALAKLEFQGRSEIPPEGDGVFVTVRWERIGHLKENGEVTVGEGVVGLVSRLERDVITNEWLVELYIPRDLARTQTRFHLNTIRANLSGVSGIEAGLFGTKVVAVPSRYPASDENQPCNRFLGESNPAPRHLPKPGDVSVILRMEEQLIGPDTPIKFRGGYAGGYVAKVLPASDGSGYVAHCFLRSSIASRLYANTVFWVDRGLLIPDVTLGRLITGDVVSVQLDPERALQGPTIWFNTPEDHGKKVDLSNVPPYDLHPIEREGFRTSYAPITETFSGEREADVELLAAEITWYPDAMWTLFRQKSFKGHLIPISGGVVGPTELLTVGRNGDRESVELFVGGRRQEYQPPTWTGRNLSFTPLKLDVPSYPTSLLGCVLGSQPTDIHVNLEGEATFAVSASRLKRNADQWIVDSSVPCKHEMHCKPVFADASKKMIGVFLFPDGAKEARVALLPNKFGSVTSEGDVPSR